MNTDSAANQVAEASPAPDYTNTLKSVGSRVKFARQALGMSVRELSRAAGLSSSFVSLVERGESSLSLTSLFAIAGALRTDPGKLIGEDQPAVDDQAKFALWRRTGIYGKPSVSLGERDYFHFSASLPGKQLEPLIVNIQPSSQPKQLSVHSGEEVAYILSGEVQVNIDGQVIVLTAGDGIQFSSAVPHSVENRTEYTAQAFWVSASHDGHIF